MEKERKDDYLSTPFLRQVVDMVGVNELIPKEKKGKQEHI